MDIALRVVSARHRGPRVQNVGGVNAVEIAGFFAYDSSFADRALARVDRFFAFDPVFTREVFVVGGGWEFFVSWRIRV